MITTVVLRQYVAQIEGRRQHCRYQVEEGKNRLDEGILRYFCFWRKVLEVGSFKENRTEVKHHAPNHRGMEKERDIRWFMHTRTRKKIRLRKRVIMSPGKDSYYVCTLPLGKFPGFSIRTVMDSARKAV
jgi:hypothetical protein